MDIVIQLISVVGGFELIKWLVRSIIYRKQERRKQDLETKKEEVLICSMDAEEDRKKIKFLEERLRERDDKIDRIYTELREEEKEHLETYKKYMDACIEKQVATVRRCDVKGCSKREPPSEY